MTQTPVHVPAGPPQTAFDATASAVATVASGTSVTIETRDARAGALLDRPTGTSFPLPRPAPGASNPLTGPIAVRDARPGDRLIVEIDEITLGAVGWCGAHAHVGPLAPGRVPEPLGRTCAVADDSVRFADDLRVPTTPMIGCLGVAPRDGAADAGTAGPHGGNLDQRPLASGARIHLPVMVADALLFAGDVHAVQGDGELSGVALECPAQLRLQLTLAPGAAPTWPWIETDDRVMVLTAASTFEEARRLAVEAAVSALEQQRGLRPAEALALLSIAADLRVGQAYGGPQLTLRLELPRSLGVVPA